MITKEVLLDLEQLSNQVMDIVEAKLDEFAEGQSENPNFRGSRAAIMTGVIRATARWIAAQELSDGAPFLINEETYPAIISLAKESYRQGVGENYDSGQVH